MKKIVSLFLTITMVLSLAACGGGGRADDAYVGKWISVAGTAMGFTLTGEDIEGFGLDLEAGGKGTMSVDGEAAKIKWTNDDTTLTLSVSGEEFVGNIGKDTLVFVNLMNLGMDLTFAKEGTDAANPENFLPEAEKNMIGTWTSYKVTDVLGDDASGVAPDALKMTFKSDKTVDIEFNGEAITGQKWSMLDTWGNLDDSEYDFSWDIQGEELEVTYNGAEYWVFTCKK